MKYKSFLLALQLAFATIISPYIILGTRFGPQTQSSTNLKCNKVFYFMCSKTTRILCFMWWIWTIKCWNVLIWDCLRKYYKCISDLQMSLLSGYSCFKNNIWGKKMNLSMILVVYVFYCVHYSLVMAMFVLCRVILVMSGQVSCLLCTSARYSRCGHVSKQKLGTTPPI